MRATGLLTFTPVQEELGLVSILQVYPRSIPAKDDPDPSRTIPVLLTLSQSPTVADLWTCFAALQNDPAAQRAYSDAMPTSPRAALAGASGPHRWRFWTVLADGEVCGLWWLHDAGVDRRGAFVWIGTYMLDGFRGQCAIESFRLVQKGLAAQGITRLFAACRVSNRAAQRFTRACGFVRAGTYDAFTVFRGRFDAAVLYALHPGDIAHLWRAAHIRALVARALAQEGGAHVSG